MKLTLCSKKSRKMHKNSTQIPQFHDFLINFQAGKAFQVAFLRKIPTKPKRTTLASTQSPTSS
jgi:hypothetical protein